MENHFPFHQITPLQNMIINIRDYGQEKIWNMIEKYHNPFKRCKARQLFAKAIQIIKSDNEE